MALIVLQADDDVLVSDCIKAIGALRNIMSLLIDGEKRSYHITIGDVRAHMKNLRSPAAAQDAGGED